MDLRHPLSHLTHAQRGPLVLFGVLFVVVLLLFGLIYLAMQINVGVRGYTSGESYWSKGRAQAVFYLDEYRRTGSEEDWQRFEQGLSAPLADHEGRLLLDQPSFDEQRVRDYFQRGGNHPEDVGMMIRLYRWFDWEKNFAAAVATWAEADQYILEMQALGEAIRRAHRDGELSPAQSATYAERIRELETTLRPLEERFSRQVGDTARHVHTTLMSVLALAALGLLLLGGFAIWRISARTFQAEERFRKTFENAPIGIAQVALDGTWSDVNPALCQILRCPRERLLGAREADFIADPQHRRRASPVEQLLNDPPDRITTEQLYYRGDGKPIWINQTVTLLRDLKGRPLHCLAVAKDVTRSHRLAEELSHRARHDALTGLINRYEFERRLRRVIQRTSDEGMHCALLYLDLDQFKVINDTCGHMAGDAMLAELSTLIKSLLRDQDTLARLGGDEFGILLEACPAETAEQIAEKIRSTITTYRFKWEERTFSLGISIGVVPFSGRGHDSAQLLSTADTGCYAAKSAGRNQIHRTHVEDRVLLEHQNDMRWLENLQRAMQERRFELVWQPIVAADEVNRREGRRFEVLLRLVDEQGQRIMPGAFLPAAERYGQAAALDRYTIDRVLEWLDERAGQADSPETVFINVSGASLSVPDFVESVRQRVARAQFPPQRLCFEITETMAISNMDAAMAFMRRLSALGCQFALDDFGIGASSFAYLSAMPVDIVKIDGSFVRDIHENKVHASIVKCINDVAHAIGKKTIAESVESAQILAALEQVGVDYVQGWHLGVPVALGETGLKPQGQ